jgi:hypothetical protein
METNDQKNFNELSAKEVVDLQYGIGHFFINYPNETLKNIMWELYSGWIYESADAVSPEQIRDMLIFYQSWGLFIDDVHQYSQHLEKKVLSRGKADI